MRLSIGNLLSGNSSSDSNAPLLKKIVSSRVTQIVAGIGLISAIGFSGPINRVKNRVLESIGISSLGNISLDEKTVPFWDENPEYFERDYQYKKQNYTVNVYGEKQNIRIIHDAGLDFYVVTKKDFCTKSVPTGKFRTVAKRDTRGHIIKNKKGTNVTIKKAITRNVQVVDLDNIINKLSQIDNFGYLARPEYRKKIKSFNISDQSASKEGMLLPIPLDSEARQISEAKLAYYSKNAINEIRSHNYYGPKIDSLVETIGEKELIINMLAFARSETASDGVPIGFYELNRREKGYKCFSFTYYHILMRDEGLKARLRLGLSEGQCIHPANAGKLFLAYWIEKTNGNLHDYFPLSNSGKLRKAGIKYNGSPKYVPKLESNYIFAKNSVS